MSTMNLKQKLALLFAAVFLLTGAFCVTAEADAGTDAFGRLVFEGKDGWLFYSGDDTIADYRGSDLYTMSQLEDLRKRLVTFRDTLASQGCEFVVLIAPNKEQVYSEYMPDSYGKPAFYTRARQVTAYLRAAGIRVVYPLDELKAAAVCHPDYDIYYRRDTHWNELGAYVGAKALMAELGIEMPPIEELVIEPVSHDDPGLGKAIGRSLKDTGYNVSGYIDESLDVFEELGEYVFHTMKSGEDSRKILLAGDSFTISLYPYVSQQFNDMVLCTDKEQDIQSLLESGHPDIYVYEVVERYFDVVKTGAGLTAPYSWTLQATASIQ